MAGVTGAGVAFEVVSRRAGFWRLGRQWPALSIVALTEDEVARLKADPNFVVYPAAPGPVADAAVEVTADAPGDGSAEPPARKRNTRAG